jgi:voltage-gated potassium channel
MPVRTSAKLGLGLFALAIVYSLIFMGLMNYEGQHQNVDLITAIYWVTITITTLGFGDIVFYSDIGRIFTIIVNLSGLLVLWAIVLPLVITPRIERLAKVIPSTAPLKLRGHIIICGYNPNVEKLTERLSVLNTPFLIIERSEEVAMRIYRRYNTVLGDPSDQEVLVNANLEHARLFIANETEDQNAEVILTVREISDIQIIALVDDLARCQVLRYAGASRIISPKTLLGSFIAQIAVPSERQVLPGAIALFNKLKLVELPIYPWSDLIGTNLNNSLIINTGATIVGIWQKGMFKSNPGMEDQIQLNSILMAVGDSDQLSRLRELTIGSRKEGPIIIVGYGDVGRNVAKTICKRGIKPTIIDRRDLQDASLVQVIGDGTSEEALIKAGIKDAVGTLIMVNKDHDVIYSTLLIKNLNPSTFIVARANHVKSAKKIYRAGADYVASVPIIASHMLAKIVHGEEEELALHYEDLEIKIFEVRKGSNLEGKVLENLNLEGRFGCGVVAMERDGMPFAGKSQNMLFKQGDLIVLLGSLEGIEAFVRTYDRRHPFGGR